MDGRTDGVGLVLVGLVFGGGGEAEIFLSFLSFSSSFFCGCFLSYPSLTPIHIPPTFVFSSLLFSLFSLFWLLLGLCLVFDSSAKKMAASLRWHALPCLPAGLPCLSRSRPGFEGGGGIDNGFAWEVGVDGLVLTWERLLGGEGEATDIDRGCLAGSGPGPAAPRVCGWFG